MSIARMEILLVDDDMLKLRLVTDKMWPKVFQLCPREKVKKCIQIVVTGKNQ